MNELIAIVTPSDQQIAAAQPEMILLMFNGNDIAARALINN